MAGIQTIVVVIVTLAVATPAPAATPSSGEVSNAQPRFEWTGHAAGWSRDPDWYAGQATGRAPVCLPVICDSLQVEVLDQADLTISADNTTASGPASDIVDLAVQAPDGSVTYTSSNDKAPVLLRFRNALKGTYALYLETSEMVQNDHSYTGFAQLAAPRVVAEPEPRPPAPRQPAPVAESPRIVIKTKAASARRAAKRLTVAVASNTRLTNVVARLRKGGKTLAKGALATLDGSDAIALRGKHLRKGRYTLVVSGDGPDGSKAAASVPFTLRK